MISKHKIKILRSLNTKKGRLLHKMILLEGKRLIEEVLSEKSKIKKIRHTSYSRRRFIQNDYDLEF